MLEVGDSFEMRDAEGVNRTYEVLYGTELEGKKYVYGTEDSDADEVEVEVFELVVMEDGKEVIGLPYVGVMDKLEEIFNEWVENN